jgi:hypothetical protein
MRTSRTRCAIAAGRRRRGSDDPQEAINFAYAASKAGADFTVDERRNGMVTLRFTFLGEVYRIWVTEERFEKSFRPMRKQ